MVQGQEEYDKYRAAFEEGAAKKGYDFEKDDFGFYVDNWLQEAWEVFMTIDIKGLL